MSKFNTPRVKRAIEEARECDYGRETRASVRALLDVLGPGLERRVREIAGETSGYDASRVDFFRHESREPVVMRVAGENVIFMDGTHRLAASVKFKRKTIPLIVLGYEGDEERFSKVVEGCEGRRAGVAPPQRSSRRRPPATPFEKE